MANLERGIQRDENGNVTRVQLDRHISHEHPLAVQVTEEGPRNVLEDRYNASAFEKEVKDELKRDEQLRKEQDEESSEQS